MCIVYVFSFYFSPLNKWRIHAWPGQRVQMYWIGFQALLSNGMIMQWNIQANVWFHRNRRRTNTNLLNVKENPFRRPVQTIYTLTLLLIRRRRHINGSKYICCCWHFCAFFLANQYCIQTKALYNASDIFWSTTSRKSFWSAKKIFQINRDRQAIPPPKEDASRNNK